MPSPSPALAPAADPARADRLGWLLLIPLGCLVLGQALLAQQGILPVLDGVLGDPDAYMRLNRVLHLHASGEWFDSTYPRINPPDGHVQHWTRPLDVLLLAGAWLLRPFLGFTTGLHVWGVLISPLCLALSIVALNWATAPVLDRDARMIACLLLLLQFGVVAYSSLGRPDHHSLLFLLFIVLIGLTGRLLLHEATRWTAMAAGAVVALGLWVSTEALVMLASALAALGVYWLGGDRRMAVHSRALAGWTTAFLALALGLERGADAIAAVEVDRLSIVHVALIGLIALFWSAIAARGRPAVQRAALRAHFGGAAAGRLGPARGRRRRLHRETGARGIGHRAASAALPRPPRAARNGSAAALLGRARLPLAIFLPLAVHQIRWAGYAQILLVIPYSALIGLALAQLATVAERWRAAVRPLMITIALFWPVAAVAALPREEIETANRACPLGDIGRALDQLGGGMVGAVVRLGIAAGEPIADGKLVKPGERGFLAAVLTPGMRAISVPINPTSSNSGLIFPGDRVDLILTQTLPGDAEGTRRVSETVLRNLRILAMGEETSDAPVEGKTHEKARTATLEVTPQQAEEVTLVTELGKLSLSLRSLASDDAETAIDEADEEALSSYTWDSDVSRVLRGGSTARMTVLRGSKSQDVSLQKGTN